MTKPKPLVAVGNLSKFIHEQHILMLDKLNALDDQRLDEIVAGYEALESASQQLFLEVQRVVTEIQENPTEAD